MEAQTDIQTYMERGKEALAQGQGREAAIAYAHAAQLEPNNPMVHLGLAEANMALGRYGVVQMACNRVQELQTDNGQERLMAQALLDLLDRRYDRALQNVDAALEQEPGVAYAHALRAYLLRATGQEYDAGLVRARAARLSRGGRFENCFPLLETAPGYGSGYNGTAPTPAPTEDGNVANGNGRKAIQEQVPTWSRPSGMQRQVIRTRFALSQYPGLITNILIAINVIVYIFSLLNQNLMLYGAQYNPLVLNGEYWRIVTAMFLHLSPLHVGLNMLSLFFIGPTVEMLYGKWRYLLIYLLSGIAGGILFLFLSPGGAAAGASGAIFGVFGAMGVFFIINRRTTGGGFITNWLFWLGLNLVWGFAPGSDIAVWGHVGGLVAGMILAFVLMPRSSNRRI